MAGRLPVADATTLNADILRKREKIGIIVSDWNSDITLRLLKGCCTVFEKAGLLNHLVIVHVPGAFEIPITISRLLQRKKCSGVIALGCVIKGETKHDDYLNHSIAKTLLELAVNYDKPVINGVLTTNTKKQADDRSGGKWGNKGEECVGAMLRLLGTFKIIDTL